MIGRLGGSSIRSCERNRATRFSPVAMLRLGHLSAMNQYPKGRVVGMDVVGDVEQMSVFPIRLCNSNLTPFVGRLSVEPSTRQ